MTEADVLIVGLGPTGAALAGLLGQRGVSVAVFDRLPDLYPLPRAIGMDHEVLRVVQELGWPTAWLRTCSRTSRASTAVSTAS